MAEKPIELKRQKYTITTTREDLLKEEANKIISKKGFVFSSYKTEKEKVNDYLKKQNNPCISSYNSNQGAQYQITQPNMRFKPRTDLERIYDTLKQNHPYGRGLSPTIIKDQLNSLGFTVKTTEEHGFNPEDLYEDEEYDINILDNNQKSQSKETETIKVETHRNSKEHSKLLLKPSQSVSPIKIKPYTNKPRIDNSNAKKLHQDLYNKTYFKAIENFSLFKNTCLLPGKISDKKKFSKKKNIPEVEKLPEQKTIENMNQYRINSILGSTSQIDFINLLSQTKNDKEGKFDSVDFLTKNITKKENQKNWSNKEQMERLKKLAFPMENNTKYYNPLLEKKSEIISDLKAEEKIIIDGNVYQKNDYENISKKVLEKCNFTKPIKNENVKIKKAGEAKLMCTNGISLSNFEKKYNLKG